MSAVWDIKQALIESIRELQLPEIGDNVQGQWQPDDSNVSYPLCAVLPPPDDVEGATLGTTEAIDTVYPLLVVFLDRLGKHQHEAEERVQQWREEVLVMLRRDYRRVLLRVAGARRIEVVPRTIVDPRAAAYQLVASSLLVRVTHRIGR